MAIEIIDEIRQKNNGRFPVVDTNNVKGGYYQVNTLEERDQIPEERRRLGMLCFCKVGEGGAEDQLYQLKESGWEIASLGGGNGIKSVTSQVEMFDIKIEDRQEGMLCYVKDDEKTYQLVGGTEDEHWVIFSGGGPGGGGTVANLNCDIPHSNTGVSDAPIVAAPSDSAVTIPFFFSSPNIGPGTLHIVVSNGGTVKEYDPIEIQQVPTSFTFPAPFEKSPSTYNVTMWAVDRTGQQSNKVYIRYQVALLELTTSEQNGKVVHTTTNIRFSYSISNALNKPVKVKEYVAQGNKGYELKNERLVTNWNAIQYFEIGYLEIPGTYNVKIEVMTENEETKGNELIRSLIVASPTVPQVYTDEPELRVSTDDTIRLKYRTAMSGKKELRVKGYRVLSDGAEELLMQRDVPTVQENEWVIAESLMVGSHTFKIYVQTVPIGEDTIHGDFPAVFTVHVTQGQFVAVTPVEEGLIAQFVVRGDITNTSDNRHLWLNTRNPEGGPHIHLNNLNYTNIDGWKIGQTQEDMYLRLTGRGYAQMNYQPFLLDHDRDNGEEIKGWTFEMSYRANNVGNEEARVVSCVPPGAEIPGFYVNTQSASIGTKQGNITTAVEYDEWTHIMFVIHRDYRQERDDTTGLMNNVHFMFIYINGVLSRVGEINGADISSFETDQFVLFNGEINDYGVASNFGSCDIREIRVYNRALNGDEAVRNYISTIKNQDQQKQEVEKNERGSQIPTLTVNRRTIGIDDKGSPILEPFGRVEDKNKIRCHVEYNSLGGEYGQKLPPELKLYPTSQIYFQGNSSLIYAKKNYKIRFNKFKDSDMIQGEDGQLTPPMTDDGYVNPTKAKKWKYSPFEEGRAAYPSGYNEWIPEHTFTLKTDYMESSHASNPGSARYIHDMYKTGSVKRLTPPQKAQYREWVPKQASLRSTTDGFPVRLVLDGVDEGIHIMLVDKNSKTTFGVNPYTHPETGEIIFPLAQSFEIGANSDIGAGAFRVNDLEAIQREFEPRFAPPSTYTDNLHGTVEQFSFDEDAWYPVDNAGNWDSVKAQQAIPHHLIRLITWVKETGEAYEAGLKKAENGRVSGDNQMVLTGEAEAEAALRQFKNAIQGVNGKPDYFDEGYLIDYYIFALTFGMVDNFGKNVFLTTWDGRVWYPNFYDMDSMLGIDNQGKRNRDVDLEIDDKDEVGGYHFNTSQSLLWVLTRNAFKEEIKTRYKELRQLQFFSYETASKYYMRDFMDKIPKRDYNRDAMHKYLNISKSERASYLEICGGDRRTYVSRWIKKRLIFMDSLMEYTGEYFKEMVAMRANLEQAGWIELPIKTFSPQYVSIEFTTGNIVRLKCYPHKETVFRGYIATQTNQEINIGNAEFIKEIGNIKHLRISEIYLENAKRLNRLDCSGSQMLKSLNIGPLKYLRELNCSGCTNLGTSDTNKGIDLSECENLMHLNASSTQLVSIMLPKNGSPLVELNITNCPKLETLKVTNQINLTRIPLDGCERLSQIMLQSCGNLEEFILPTLTGGKISRLSDITISDCPKIKALAFSQSSTLKFLNLSKMPGLLRLTLQDLSKNDANPDAASLQVCLNLSQGVENLEELVIHNCNIDSIRFHKTSGIRPLRTLHITNSNVTKIHYGTAGELSENMDMSGLNNLQSINFNTSPRMEEIVNLTYTKNNPGQAFRNCHKLRRVQGDIRLSGDCTHLFNRCLALEEAPTMNLTGVTTATGIFSECPKLLPNQFERILRMFWEASPSKVSQVRNLSDAFSHQGLQDGQTRSTLPSLAIDAAKFPELTNINAIFHSNGKIGGTLPNDLFGSNGSASAITTATSAFRSASGITGVGGNLLKPLKTITNTSYMFSSTNISNALPSDFFSECVKLENASAMFGWCGKLTGSVKAEWFVPLTHLTNADLMFASCSKLGSTESSHLPDHLFVHNKAIVSLRGTFYGCSSLSGSIPSNLFGGMSPSSDQRMKIKYANGLFASTSLSGEIPIKLFRWCPDLEDIGSFDNSMFGYGWSSGNRGIFGGTKLNIALPTDELGYSIFRYNEKLKRANGVFRDCTQLNTRVPEKLFATNRELTNVSQFFYECSALMGEIPANLFASNEKILNASYFFYKCQKLQGEIPSDLFETLTVATDLSHFFNGCQLIGPTIPRTLFKGLSALSKVDSFFEGCRGLTSTLPAPVYTYEIVRYEEDPLNPEAGLIPIYDWVLQEKGLFEDCTKLISAASFLKECRKVKGSIPEFIFRKNTALTNLSGFFYNCNNLTGSVPAKLFETNRGLMNISRIFYHCNKIDGWIPTGLFKNTTSLEDISYAFAWCRNIVKYPTDDIMTCVPSGLFENCPLVKAEGVFEACTSLSGTLPPLFSFKTKLQTVAKAFASTAINGPVTDNFMNNCTMLQNMECLFDGCSRLTSISKNLLSDDMNIVTNAKHCFKGCSGVSGEVPNFQRQPSANKTGAFAGMNPELITNYNEISDWTTSESWHAHVDPYQHDADEYID